MRSSFVEVKSMNEPGNKTKVLVVEDDVAIQQVLCIYLRYAGFEVGSVANGRDAIRIIPEFCPQLIVLDLMMQPIDGWGVLEWLRANQGNPPIPVLVLTARTHLTEQAHGFEAGAVEYLTKPTQPSILVERIQSILSLSPEQRLLLMGKRLADQRNIIERLYAPQPDEFIY
jgi:DNA-binding response OmpR family regulator